MPRRVRKTDPEGLEPPAGARNKEESYCENRKRPATSDSSFDPFFLLTKCNIAMKYLILILMITLEAIDLRNG